MDFESLDSDNWSIFSLTENISSSFVDPDKLILVDVFQQERPPIGMSNFRSKNKLMFNNNKPQRNQHFTVEKSLSSSSSSSSSSSGSVSTASQARMRWKAAAAKVKFLVDPWCEFKLEKYPAERCIRHRYNAIKKQWLKDECFVKIEPDQFSNGAMRACFRL